MVAGESGFVVEDRQRRKTIAALANWVKQQAHLVDTPSLPVPLDWVPLGGDAGFRHYFRLPESVCQNARCMLAVWSPPATEKNAEFVKLSRFLRKYTIHTPEIFAVDESRGFMLIEDFGDELLYKRLNNGNADKLYGDAFDVLLTLKHCPLDKTVCPEYNKRELLRELHLFPQWFVSRLLGYVMSDDEKKLLDDVFEQLCLSAMEQPRVVVHRDFHSRNLLLVGDQGLGVIDFQDAVIGPVTYDLVSLLRDCYVSWPAERVNRWVEKYVAQLHGRGELLNVDHETFKGWFDWMGLQRHIKVLGIFARLYLRDGKEAYLNDLPLVIQYVRSVVFMYPELKSFSDWFDSALMPLANRQEWMNSDD